MALNTFQCNCQTPLVFNPKGLKATVSVSVTWEATAKRTRRKSREQQSGMKLWN